MAPPAGAGILEVGCGPAAFWAANLDRIDPSWRLTLTDFSPGMIEAARAALGDRAEYLAADVQELPFPDAVFADVGCDRYEDSLEVTEIEPVVAFVRSGIRFRGDVDALRTAIEAAFAPDGVLRIGKDSGVFHARRP